MLESILANRADKTETLYLADIGAGSCYWPASFLRRTPNLQITAIDPSKPLILDQARDNLAKSETVGMNLERLCMTGQEFSNICSTAKFAHGFDCIYFMQSAHYIGDEEFEDVFTRFSDGLRTRHGTVVIQARNMTPEWYPWAFPKEWKENVEDGLAAQYSDKAVVQEDIKGDVRSLSSHQNKSSMLAALP